MSRSILSPGASDDPISMEMVAMVLIAGLVAGLLVGYLIAGWMAQEPLSQAKLQLADAQSQVDMLQLQLNQTQRQASELGGQVERFRNQSRQNYLGIFSPADMFQSKFHDLMQEHDILLADALRRSLSSTDSYNASYFALKDNVHRIAEQIAFVYGSKNAEKFIQLWDTKIDNFLKYSRSIQSNDAVIGNLVFDQDMGAYEEQSASFWADLNPYIKKEILKQAVADHVELVKKCQDYWATKSYSDYFVTLHQSYDQMGSYADIIVSGIIQQHPELFLNNPNA